MFIKSIDFQNDLIDSQTFEEVATLLNRPRSANSRHDKLTGSAVHTRYKRNCRFISATKGEVLRPCELDLQARTNLRAIGQRVPAGFREDEDRRLVEAYQYFRDYVVTGI